LTERADGAAKDCDLPITKLAPKYAWSNKGVAFKALGRTAEADAAFTKAKELRV
jgi:hypothetical protein